ncbi:MAG: Na(+)-translocating NADH-quinone reductase subunit C [Salinibacterium sp.]|nr:Na(+)-translocating NADH-quinone reductase subunit C [Salinibacterium sp.]
MKRDSTANILRVGFLVSIICSVLVTGAAVLLRERQQENRVREKKRNVLVAAGVYRPGTSIEEEFARFRPVVVELATGLETDDNLIDVAAFDQRVASRDPAQRVAIPEVLDLARIKRRERFSVVYKAEADGKLDALVLPVNGSGLFSTLYGFIALESDLSTIRGLTFYEHGETAGLGAEIDNPRWKAKWKGKRAFDAEGRLVIQVVKGGVDPTADDREFKVDGLSGATLTSNGVEELLRYWLGAHGFGPYIAMLRGKGN